MLASCVPSSPPVAAQLELGFSFTASASAPNTESLDAEDGLTTLSLRAVSAHFCSFFVFVLNHSHDPAMDLLQLRPWCYGDRLMPPNGQ